MRSALERLVRVRQPWEFIIVTRPRVAIVTIKILSAALSPSARAGFPTAHTRTHYTIDRYVGGRYPPFSMGVDRLRV